jgi:RNA recognition motif-containing protein
MNDYGIASWMAAFSVSYLFGRHRVFSLCQYRFFCMNIYVGNLPYSVNSEALRTLFEGYGTVDTSSVVSDRFTGQSKGFGFVEMSNQAEAQAAIDALNQMNYQGRALVVNEARPREERPRRDFRDGNRRGGGFRRGEGEMSGRDRF